MKTLIVLVVIVLVVIGGFFLLSKNTKAPSDTTGLSVSPTSSPAPSPLISLSVQVQTGPKLWEISLGATAMSAQNLTIHPGDTVKFTNTADTLRWPASDPHPTHTDCPGFDAYRGLQKDQSYSFTFKNVAVCGFHDHLHARDANFSGKITVAQ